MKVLAKSYYNQIIPFLEKVEINHYFAKSVLKNQMPGTVFVDDIQAPTSFYITTEYGMSLLFGATDNVAFNDSLTDYVLNKNRNRQQDEWLQVYPRRWSAFIESLSAEQFISADRAEQLPDELSQYPNYVIQNTRVNFTFDQRKFIANKLKHTDFCQHRVVSVSEEIFEQLQGSVVPKNFWHSASDFIAVGKGFSVYDDTNLVATSYSATIDKGTLEIGIETKAQGRGKGYAFIVCQALIEYCLANDIVPVWACRLENIGSYRLAKKLGFEPSKFLPYYRLCKNG